MENTQEGNRLIAEFMGGVYKDLAYIRDTFPVIEFKDETHGLHCHPIKELKYHSSWDWIMPVLEKIASTKLYYFEVSARTCSIKGTNGRPSPDVYGSGKTTIEATWEAATEFIDWYNATDYLRTNKPQPNAK